MAEQKSRAKHSFSTQEELPTVAIDEEEYELRLDMAYVELLRLQGRGDRIMAIAKQPERTAEEEEELETLLKETIPQMLAVPEDVAEKLTDFQRMRILAIYGELVEERTENPTESGKT